MSTMTNVSDILSYNKKAKVKERQVSTLYRWTSASIESAINNMLVGDFAAIVQLSRAMLLDPAIKGAVSKRVNAFIRSNFCATPENDSETAMHFASLVEKEWFNSIISDSALSELITDKICFGISLAFVEWETNKEGFEIPKICPMNVEFLRYYQHNDTWTYSHAQGIETIDFENNPNWLLITDWKPGKTTGDLPALTKLWMLKKYSEANWQEGNNRMNDNTVLVKELDKQGIQLEQTTFNTFAYELMEQKKDRVIQVPVNFEIEIKDSLSTSFSSTSFSDLIEYCDRKIQVLILGQNTSSEIVDQGSRATAEVHNNVERGQTLSDIALVSSALRDKVITDLITINFKTKENIPFLNWSIPDQYNLNELAVISDLLASYGKEIENIDEIMETFGVKVKLKDTEMTNVNTNVEVTEDE